MKRIIILLAIIFSSVVPANAVEYEIIDLGTFGGSDTRALSINNSSQIVGVTGSSGFLYENNSMVSIGGSWASEINDSSQIVGVTGSRGFLYENGTMTVLATLGGSSGYAYVINNSGQIAGRSDTSDGWNHAFLYDNGAMTDLGTLSGNRSTANGINDSGQIIGESSLPNSDTHAFLYENDTMIDIGTLGGKTSFAHDINSNSQIVGSSQPKYSTSYHAYIYDNGIWSDLEIGRAHV